LGKAYTYLRMKLVSCFFGLAAGQFGFGGGNDILSTYAYSSLLKDEGGLGDLGTYALLSGNGGGQYGQAVIANEVFGGGLTGAISANLFTGNNNNYGGGYYGGGYQQQYQQPYRQQYRQPNNDFLTTYALSGALADGGSLSGSSALPLLALSGGLGGNGYNNNNAFTSAITANALGGGVTGTILAQGLGGGGYNSGFGGNNIANTLLLSSALDGTTGSSDLAVPLLLASSLGNNNQQPYRPYRPAPIATYTQPAYVQSSAYVQPASYVRPAYVQPSAYASVYPTTYSQTLYPTTFATQTYTPTVLPATTWPATTTWPTYTAPAMATTWPTYPAVGVAASYPAVATYPAVGVAAAYPAVGVAANTLVSAPYATVGATVGR